LHRCLKAGAKDRGANFHRELKRITVPDELLRVSPQLESRPRRLCDAGSEPA
jgi:hypothetical protein